MPRLTRIAQLFVLALSCAVPAAIAYADEQAPSVALSAQAATRAAAVSPPAISAPASAVRATDQAVTIQADASDPDAGDILTITQTGAPASLTFSHTPSASPAVATLSGTLGSSDEGVYSILWEVSDGTGSASTTTALTVNANSDPLINAPANVLSAETVDFAFAVTVSDPDGDPITSITSTVLPTGATFTPNGFLTAGEFFWLPAIGQAGDYTVTFTVESGTPTRSASATTNIHINPRDRAPVVTAPATVNHVTDVPLVINVTASDPDGDVITSFIARGTQSTPLPVGATFAANGTNTTGVFNWTPTSAQAGTVSIDFIATSGVLGLRTIAITKIVVRVDRAPVVTAPASVPGAEGSLVTVSITASDPDATPITSLTMAPFALGAMFTAGPGNTSGTLNWTPDFTQAGTYNAVFTATNALSGSATTQLLIANTNRDPVANAGGPYTGTIGVPINFNGSASSDPDGDVLTFAWDFGDGNTGTGATPAHTYAAAGSYNVTLRVTDPGALFGDAATTASVQAFLAANAFNLNYIFPQIIPTWVRVEPIGGSFDVGDVLVSSATMTYNGMTIPTKCKSGIAGDVSHNGVTEIRICFAKNDLKNLFAGLPNGTSDVVVTVRGDLVGGGVFSGDVAVHVIKFSWLGAGSLASVSPNPLNPQATLSFVTTQPGVTTVQVFDPRGRLVRNVMPRQYLMPGLHELTLDGRNENGNRLASGVYFYRVQSAEGVIKGSFSVLK